MVAVNSLLYFLLSAGLSANPEQAQDAQNYDTLNGLDIGSLCPPKEKLSLCDAHCQKNCTNFNKPIICPLDCVKGCVCDEGLVRGQGGKCVPPTKCPAKDSCPRGEHYEQCNAHCQWNCTNYLQPIPCPRICAHGCVCDEGTVRGPTGKCIRPGKCPKTHANGLEDELIRDSESFCPVNEVYSPCMAHCQRDCSNWDDAKFSCSKMCSSGCVCEKGMVRGPNGACIMPSQCTSKREEDSVTGMSAGSCPEGEYYDINMYDCQKNCSNWDRPIICPRANVPGCVCNPGTIRSVDGGCITPDQCPKKASTSRESSEDTSGRCPRYEKYSPCSAHCQKNCSNYDKEVPCTRDCRPGCICEDDRVRGPDGKCIYPNDCPWIWNEEPGLKCPKGEHYDRCQLYCQKNCSNYNQEIICPLICAPGCVCNIGLVRGDDGKCINPEQCRKEEVISESTGNIDQQRKNFINIIRADIAAERARAERCPRYEKYSPCSAHCQKNCSNKDKEIPCTRDCNPGCICEDNRVRGPDGKCIYPNDCPWIWNEQHVLPESKKGCPAKEHMDECNAHCQKNCTNFNKPPRICPTVCVKGCVCDEGLVRNQEGMCVAPKQCPGKDVCPRGEHYNQCSAHCQRNCSTWGKPLPCPRICVHGCVCDLGTVRGPNGKCIRPDKCPKKSFSEDEENGVGIIEAAADFCPTNEEYSPCSARCETDCRGHGGFCPRLCIRGCKCKREFVRGPKGTCIKREECTKEPPKPRVCPENEKLSPCLAACQLNCTTKDKGPMPCPAICVPGCICKEGLIRGVDGQCIPRDQCPAPNRQSVEEVSDAWIYIQDEVSTRSDENSEDDLAVPFKWEPAESQEELESTHASADFCPKNEEYSPCSARCETDCRGHGGFCPRLCISGCKCKRGFVRGPKGTCIKREECTKEPPKPRVCPENERLDSCRGACQLNCTTKDKGPMPCPALCVPGCICKEGLIRGVDGQCIPRDQCPAPNRQSVDEVAEEDSTWIYETFTTIYKQEEDSTRSDENSEEDLAVPFKWDPTKSQEELESTHGLGQFPIPVICKRNETFNLCPCNLNCDNKDEKDCTAVCELPPKCDCRSGYVTGPKGNCIQKEECPRKKPEDCTELEFYDSCGSACPDTCSNMDQKDRQCIKNCKIGCFCIPGMVRGPDGSCVFPFECTPQSPFQ